MNGLTGQSVPARERYDATVLDAAQPPLGGNPQRTAHSKCKSIHPARAKPFCDCVRCLNSTVCEVGYTTLRESEPESVLRTISQQNTDIIIVSQIGEGDFLDDAPLN
jgi:hypothetical protein